MPMPLRGKSVLMTPDPYHTPGYGGFCPQFKYQIGETFGRTTSRLLRDNQVASSGRLVLSEIYPHLSEADKIRNDRITRIRARTQSWGDQKLVERMVPGYTGFIPQSQHYFGGRYAENCVNAISDFESDQRQAARKREELATIEALQTGKIEGKPGLPQTMCQYKTPLQPIRKEPALYILKKDHLNAMLSPYFLTKNDPNKCFMSGYTGFVPRAWSKVGQGYPLITHNALNEFTDSVRQHREIMSKPVTVQIEKKVPINTKPVYPIETGLVPHYTGHIPGEKFRYGSTFGFSTRNALKSKQPSTVVVAS